MDLIRIERKNNCGVVDSRLIAIEMGIQHKNFYQTIKDNQTDIEEAFGQILFETETVRNAVGALNEVKFAYLNEDQATYLMTLSRNTPQVKKLKLRLVKSFSQAKQIILSQQVAQPQLPQRDAIAYIEATDKLNQMDDGILTRLLRDALVDELALKQNLRALPSAPKQEITIVKVRAKELGYSEKQIGSGSALGRFVAKKVKHLFFERIGVHEVKHYEVNDELDSAIHAYFLTRTL